MERLLKVSSHLAKNGVDALLIGKPENIFYACGFQGEDSWLFLLKDGAAYLLTDARFREEAERDCPRCTVLCQKSGADLSVLLGAVCQKVGIREVHFEGDFFSYQQYVSLREEAPQVAFSSAAGLLEELRAVKEPEEIQLLRQAAAIGDAAFTAALPLIRPGLTEKDLAEILRQQMIKAGADALSFPVIAAAGPNCSICHAKPGDTVLRPGDMVLMDFGCIYRGYCGDMTRTVMLGPIERKAKEVYELVLAAQNAAFSVMAPGIPLETPYWAAMQVFEEAGVGDYFVHSLGHGVGLEIHEAPRMSRGQKDLIMPRQVITVEPGLYLPGWGGVRIEDVAVFTEESFENITKSPKELLIL